MKQLIDYLFGISTL